MPHSRPAVRRAISLLLAGVLLAAALVLALPGAHACGCGGLVSPEEDQVQVEQETAAISWDGQTERIVLSMTALAETEEAALLLPTPSPAEVDLAADGVFAELAQITAPQVQTEYRWWPESSSDSSAAAPQDAGAVEVLQTVDLGPLEASVLSAGDAGALSQWLEEHGYVMGDALADTVSPYVAEGWYYVAIRLQTDQETLTGRLPPLDITFESSAIIYPMRMSAAADSPQSVQTYVFADQRVARTDATAENLPAQVRYAGRPEAGQIENPTVREMLDAGEYLTALDQTFTSPATQITSDFVFERSANGGDHREVTTEVRMREILGYPAGPVLLTGGLVVLAAVTALRPWRLLR